ncbi:MAG: ABC transporter permease [Actinomycetota bacterium]
MTDVGTAPTTARRAPIRRDLQLLWRAIKAENRLFWRTPIGAFFTIGLPLVMLVLFVALFGNDEIGETRYGNITTAQFYAASLAVFAAASATYTNIAINLTMRRDDGVLKRVRGTPIPPWVFLAGAVFSGVWIAMFSTAVMVGLGVVAYGVTIDLVQIPAMFVAFVIGTVCFSALGLALASVAKTASAAPAIANATILPMAFVSDVFIPLDDPPRWLTLAGDILPLKPFAVAFSQAMSPFTDAPAFEWDRFAVMAAWTVLGAVVAAKKFRWEPVPGATKGRGRRNRRSAD